MFNENLYEEMVENAKQENLADFILNLLFDKPSEQGDLSMVGICPSLCYVEQPDDETYQIYDELGHELCQIKQCYVDDYSNDDYVWHRDLLADLCDRIQQIVDAEKIIWIK